MHAAIHTGELPEIRALMLERLGRHREALVLYVHDLHDLNAAEAYCDRWVCCG
jgi:ABC-type hemin transport system ATPase subunit